MFDIGIKFGEVPVGYKGVGCFCPKTQNKVIK